MTTPTEPASNATTSPPERAPADGAAQPAGQASSELDRGEGADIRTDEPQDPPPGPPSPPAGADQPPAGRPGPRRYRWWRLRRSLRWLRSWRAFSATVTAWWFSPWAHEIRAAYYDTKRAPGWVVFGAILVFWPITGFSLVPVGVAAVAWALMMWITRQIRYWFLRRRIRRFCRPLIGVLALAVLTVQAGLYGWLLALGLWLVAASVTDTLRARSRLAAWVIEAVARTLRADPAEFDISRAQWDQRRLLSAEVAYGPMVRTEDPASRDRIAQTVAWSLRHAGRYTVSWPPGTAAFGITSTPALPTAIDEQDWGDMPGIPIGATDEETADGYADTVDADTGAVVESLPIALLDPGQEQRHILVVGGTGGGKSTWMRGFIARGVRKGWWPGGVFIFDGKSGSDYIVFEDREDIQCVAREPEEWASWLARVAQMMRARYEEAAEYERGNRPKPDFPRYLVVFDEFQEIRATLGKDEVDPVIQQVSRQIRASEGRLMVSTQRPDAEDAIPGAVKDMLEERIILGFVSGTGARMVLDQDWREVVDEYGADSVPGRGMARIRGRLRRIQGFYLPTPREHPEVEHLYPRKRGAGAAEDPPSEADQVIQWTPAPATPDPSTPVTDRVTDDVAKDVETRTSDAHTGRPEAAETPPEPATQPPGQHSLQDPVPGPAQAPRRRRRTV